MLSVPTGGWTWPTVQSLAVELYRPSGQSAFLPEETQIEVTYDVPLLNEFSISNAGFTAGHPFSPGSAVNYTVQAGNALTNGTTYSGG